MTTKKEEPVPKSGAQPPEESSTLLVKPISKAAGGIPAALTAVKYAFGEMGVIRGTRTLLQLNQKEGID